MPGKIPMQLDISFAAENEAEKDFSPAQRNEIYETLDEKVLPELERFALMSADYEVGAISVKIEVIAFPVNWNERKRKGKLGKWMASLLEVHKNEPANAAYITY